MNQSYSSPAMAAVGALSEPWLHRPSTLAEGHVYVYGAGGDFDPGFVLEDVLITNDGGEDLFVATTLTGAVGTARGKVLATTGTRRIEGPVDSIVLHNAQGSGGVAQWDIQARRTAIRNVGKAAGHPGHGELHRRATPVANATTPYTLTVRQRLTITSCKTWTKVPASGATCTLAVSARGNNLLSAATVNVTTLTTVTLQSHALTATAAHLDLEVGDTITLTVVGGAGLTPGDLLAALGYTLR